MAVAVAVAVAVAAAVAEVVAVKRSQLQYSEPKRKLLPVGGYRRQTTARS